MAQDWDAALALGVRLAVITPEAAARAKERLVARSGDPLKTAEVAEWAGVEAIALEDLLRLVAEGSRGTLARAIRQLAQELLATPPTVSAATTHRDPPSDSPPTVPFADMPTTPATTAPPISPRPKVPRSLGPYALIEELGHGGMGVVYRAKHANLGTECAVKVLIAGEHASLEAIARFHREAAAVAKMGKHPNIVTVFDLGQEGGLTYYAMELVRGKSLHERLVEHAYEPKEAAALVEKVARALHFAHGHGIIHRDVKPQNVIVREDGEPQVMDFGLARDVSSGAGLSATGDVFGSPNYMAPEQVRGLHEECDARTDVYGLGGVLYEVLTKLPPHPGRVVADIFAHILRGDVLSPRWLTREVPQDLETICLKCLDPERARRYRTAEALADDLARFLRGEPVVARPVGMVGRAVRRLRKHPLISALTAALVVLAIGLAWRVLGPATIIVDTDPPGAKVEAIGTSLWRGRWIWPAKTFTLLVSAEGYEEARVAVDASAGATIRKEVRLVLDHGFLTVRSEPAGAEVWVGGALCGQRTPAEGIVVKDGDRRVVLRLANHEEYSTYVTIRSGETRAIDGVKLVHEQGTLRLDGCPRGVEVAVRSKTGDVVTRLSPPVVVPLDTGEYALEGHLKDHFDRRYTVRIEASKTTNANMSLAPQVLWTCKAGGARGSPALGDVNGDGVLDCVVGSNDKNVYALSGSDGAVLWAYQTDGGIVSSPALGDLNGDGVPDCVVGSLDDRVYALSGKDGSLLWSHKTDHHITGSPALGDLNGDGVLDCVIGSSDGKIYAVSGKDGTLLWSYQTRGEANSRPALADVNGDGVLDCVVGSLDKKVYALSGKDGSLYSSYETGGEVWSSPALGDLNGDGVLDCAVVSADGMVHALSVQDVSILWTHATGDEVWSSPALGDLNRDGVLDCVVGSNDCSVYALSGGDGAVLWAYQTGGWVMSSPALGDLNVDGILDCVVGSNDKRVYALSGKDGAVLWSHELGGEVPSSPALGDLNRDGVLDCIVGSVDKRVYALSGKDGSVLWSHETGAEVLCSPALADLNGDGVLDCVVGSNDKKVCALSGRDGALLWSYLTGDDVRSTRVLADLNGDGVLDCVVGSLDKKVYALSGMDGALLWTCESGKVELSSPSLGNLNGDGLLDCVMGSTDGRLYAISCRRPLLLSRATETRRLRRGRWWRSLLDFAVPTLGKESDPWSKGMMELDAGVARSWKDQPADAIRAFADARKLHLRAPDGAVYEWVASRLWMDCPPERRKEADEVFLDALGFEPDVVFDTLVECRDLLAKTDAADLRALLDRAADTPACAIERPLLLALPMPDGSRPYANGADLADLLGAARRRVSSHIEKGEGSVARWRGYLALIANTLGEKDVFARTYATYLDLPRRPASLDALLSEAVAHEGK